MPHTFSPRQDMFLIIALLISNVAHVIDFVVVMPLGPMLMKDFNIPAVSFGHIVSVYTFAAAASSFLSSFWLDRFNRKTSMVLLLIGFLLANLMCANATTEWMLMLGRVVAGFFGGVISALVYSIIGQVIPASRRGRAMGVIGMSFPLVSIIGVPLALYLGERFNWRAAFFLVLGFSLLALLLSYFSIPSIEPETDRASGHTILTPIIKVFRYRPHLSGFLLVTLTVFGGFTIVPYLAPFLINHEYIKSDQLFLIYLVGGLGSIIGSRVIGTFADKKGKIVMLRWTLVLAMLSIGLLTNLPQHSLWMVLLATSATMIFLPGRFVCVIAYLSLIADKNNRGAFMSLVSTLQQLTIGISTIVGGYLVGETSDGRFSSYWLVGVVAILANTLIYLMSSHLRRIEPISH